MSGAFYQYLRACSLIVANEKGDGLELSELEIRFTVFHQTVQSPSAMNARIYNLSSKTMDLIRKEFTTVTLKAGYRNPGGQVFASIFEGYIIQARTGRESPTETFLDIVAADGDPGYVWAGLNKTLAAGHRFQDVQKAIDDAWAEHKITPGHKAEMPETKFPRGRAMLGNARDYARDLGFSTGHTWGIKSGKYETVKLDGVLPGEEIVLNSHTGLIGLPQETIDGVQARCLLNPYIWHNRSVLIDNRSIQKMAFPSPPTTEGVTNFLNVSGLALSSDGRYRVIAVDHIGDLRGQSWYTDMWLIGTGGNTISQTILNMDIGPQGPVVTQPVVSTRGTATPPETTATAPAGEPGHRPPGY